MTKPATQNYVAFRRIALAAFLSTATAGLTGCSSGDYAASPPPRSAPAATAPSQAAQPTVIRADLPPPAPHTGADGYPNVNVDTASPTRTPIRSAEDRDRLEAELMALGERQRSNTGGAPQSVVQELQELGRRSKAETLKQIESGKAPDQP